MTTTGTLAPRTTPPRRRISKRTTNRLVRTAVWVGTSLLIVVAIVSANWEKLRQTFLDPEIFAEQFPDVVTIAAKNTVILTFISFGIGLGGGLVLAVMRLSSFRFYRWLSAVYIEVFRGLPAILTLLFVGPGLSLAFDIKLGGPYITGGVGLGIVAAAYMAETIRAGIEAVPRGQMEAARSLGMGYSRSMVTIVIPQAFRIIVPPLTNELVLLVKDTALIFFVLGSTPLTEDLARFARDATTATFNLTPLLVAGMMYLVITIPLTRLAGYLEARARRAK